MVDYSEYPLPNGDRVQVPNKIKAEDVTAMFRASLRFDEAMIAVSALSNEQRLKLFSGYCHGCGTDDLPCNCMRDE